MAQAPERTFIENPDAALDSYTIEDAVRDISYNTAKLKLLVELMFRDFPGFISLANVQRDPNDPAQINIGSWMGIDLDRNVILYTGAVSVLPSDLQLDKTYWITARVSTAPTSATRRNERQGGRRYNYVLREDIELNFPEMKPIQELTLGQVRLSIGEESGALEATFTRTDQSPLLSNVYDLYEQIGLGPGDLDSRYVIKERFDPETGSGGQIVRELQAGDDLTAHDIETIGLVAGINDNGKIDTRLIDTVQIIDNLSSEVTIEAGSSLTIVTSNPRVKLTVSNGPEEIFGEFVFDSSNQIDELRVSENVRSQENPEFSNTADLLYVSSVLNVENQIEITIKNNFGSDKLVRYRID